MYKNGVCGVQDLSGGRGVEYKETEHDGYLCGVTKETFFWRNTNLDSCRHLLHYASLGFLHVVLYI